MTLYENSALSNDIWIDECFEGRQINGNSEHRQVNFPIYTFFINRLKTEQNILSHPSVNSKNLRLLTIILRKSQGEHQRAALPSE